MYGWNQECYLNQYNNSQFNTHQTYDPYCQPQYPYSQSYHQGWENQSEFQSPYPQSDYTWSQGEYTCPQPHFESSFSPTLENAYDFPCHFDSYQNLQDETSNLKTSMEILKKNMEILQKDEIQMIEVDPYHFDSNSYQDQSIPQDSTNPIELDQTQLFPTSQIQKLPSSSHSIDFNQDQNFLPKKPSIQEMIDRHKNQNFHDQISFEPNQVLNLISSKSPKLDQNQSSDLNHNEHLASNHFNGIKFKLDYDDDDILWVEHSSIKHENQSKNECERNREPEPCKISLYERFHQNPRKRPSIQEMIDQHQPSMSERSHDELITQYISSRRLNSRAFGRETEQICEHEFELNDEHKSDREFETFCTQEFTPKVKSCELNQISHDSTDENELEMKSECELEPNEVDRIIESDSTQSTETESLIQYTHIPLGKKVTKETETELILKPYEDPMLNWDVDHILIQHKFKMVMINVMLENMKVEGTTIVKTMIHTGELTHDPVMMQSVKFRAPIRPPPEPPP